MYQSVFKDFWGSDSIFAGHHKTFTKGNKTNSSSHVIFGIHSFIGEYEDEQDNWTDEREYDMITDDELGLTVHPFPFNPQDILDVGGQIKPDLRNCNYVLEELDPTYLQHYCGVHKAIIPIARMEDLVDEDDTADTITYRCPECSKCVVCKRSLQESVEQTIIDSSVKLDLENKRVVVKLPWVRDPIQPLIDKHQGSSNIYQVLRV